MQRTGLMALFVSLWAEGHGQWAGVDEAVVGRFAAEAGRKPLISWPGGDKGDLLLFFFLCAGTAGGIAIGYCYRMLFAEKPDLGRARSDDDAP